MLEASLTIGIEEEYQIIDPKTQELRSYVQQFLEQGKAVLADQIRPEFLQSQIEAGTQICRDVDEAREELIRIRRSVMELADDAGLWVAAAGTHPFSSWVTQRVSPFGRYPELVRFLQDVGRQLLVFGMHVHLGIEDRELLIDIMNQLRYFLPHLLALSTSSPFWHGRDTGLKSYRSVVFENLPRTGIPQQFESYGSYRGYADTLLTTGSIAEPTHIWWDVRPSEKFPTLEIRIPDMCTRLEETLCLVALVQAIAAKLVQLRQANQSWRLYRKDLIDENKWRALRYGIQGRLIDFGKKQEVPFPILVKEILEWVDDVVDDLGSREEIEYAYTILREGSSADRQLAVYRQTEDLRAVVEHVVEETREGIG
jgi:carboxylate-amine ligase